MKSEEYITISDGQITKRLKLPDGQYLAKFYPRKVRSYSQNNYYWMCLELILDGLHDIGYREVRDKMDVHELLKQMFLKRRIINEQTGEVIGELSRSTAELTKDEMSIYISQIDDFCLEYLGFRLPTPNSQLNFI